MIFLKNFYEDKSAVISFEAAILLPFLLLAVFSGYDLVSYINISNTIDRTSIITADFSSQNTTVCADRSSGAPSGYDVGLFFDAAYKSALPIDIVKDGKVIITSIVDNGTVAKPNPIISWQVSEVSFSYPNLPKAYGLTDPSRLVSATKPNVPVLPNGFTLQPGENIIVAEIFYNYKPIFLGAGIIFSTTLPEIYRVSFYRPRQGDLSTLLPNTDPKCAT